MIAQTYLFNRKETPFSRTLLKSGILIDIRLNVFLFGNFDFYILCTFIRVNDVIHNNVAF